MRRAEGISAMSQPVARRASVTESRQIARLVVEAYGHYPARIGSRPATMDLDYAIEIAEKEVWVCPRAGEIRAVMVLRPESDHIFVDNLAVAPQAQGRGLGRVLLEHAAARARALGVPELRLRTHELMTENRALYAHLGWEQIEGPPDELCRVYLRKAIR